VVKVADDELFGPDGTQAPPAPPFLSDPLAGLVTGVLFSDTTSVADVVPAFVVDPVAPSVTRARRRAAPGPARTGAQPLTAATSIDDYEWALRQAISAAQDDAFLRSLPAQ